MQPSSRNALVIAIICIAIVAFWATSPAPPNDQQMIQRQIATLVKSSESRSISKFLDVLSSDYTDDNDMDKARLGFYLNRVYQRLPNVVVTTSPPLIVVSGDTAVSDEHVVVTDTDSKTTVFDRPVHFAWRKEKTTQYVLFKRTQWLITNAKYGNMPDE